MKLVTILGARPQFIKAATVSRAIQRQDGLKEIIVHTGQHFDANMSDVFFKQLDIPRPAYNLGIAGLSHGVMTGRMLEGIENIILKEKPDWLMVYGDTNSTLAAALAGSKQQVPIVHVEAGLRSCNLNMPEEINRVLTDRVSTLLLCPTETAVANLLKEGFPFKATSNQIQRIENVGDVMYDAVLYYRQQVHDQIPLGRWGLAENSYALCTLHRQENTDDPERLNATLSALSEIAHYQPVILPLHPRTRVKITKEHSPKLLEDLIILEPLPYLEMQRLQMSAGVILTDSGGMQKEAYFHAVPCITLRDETEWVETVAAGWNQLVGANKEQILTAFHKAAKPNKQANDLFGDGTAAEKIVEYLK